MDRLSEPNDESHDRAREENHRYGDASASTRSLLETRLEENERDSHPVSGYKYTLRVVKVISLLLIGGLALLGMVLSKITFISITSRMYNLYMHRYMDKDDDTINRYKSATFFQLVTILVIPEILSLGRCLLWGFIGKSSKTYPWPRWKSVGLGLVSSTFEVVALCGFVFGVASKLPPSLTILLLNGVFSFAIAKHLFCPKGKCCFQTESCGSENTGRESTTCLKHILIPLLETIAFLMQLGTLIAIPILLYVEDMYNDEYLTVLMIPVTLIVISVVWSSRKKKKLVGANSAEALDNIRMKSGLINSLFKTILLPFLAYGFAFLLLDFQATFSAEIFHWTDLELITFLTQICISYLAYLFIWMACALRSWAYFFAMFFATPVSFLWYICSVKINAVFPFVDEYFVNCNLRYNVLVVASILWISQILAFAYYMFQNSEKILTNDADMFWTPRYNGVFLEQFMLLNRKTDMTGYYGKQATFNPCEIAMDSHIFICSTMYHENEVEMEQMLKSIGRIAKASEPDDEGNHKYESHIFFDSACVDEQLNKWVMQLLSLLKKILGVDPAKVKKLITPYGIQLKYLLPRNMPFYIHLKDNRKVKNKKRWSQVMYMNYVLNYRIKQTENLENQENRILKEKAFILTTDADVDFTSNDVVALLDILAKDAKVGAVCGRTHPLGSGPVVWYQIFDYAIGHWFQKAAEHVLGSVLCCPGCFSAFRVSALEDVLDIYSSSVENGFDFLTKDMGEDRWLCTLLIQAGWKLEYSAVSTDGTFCPESFTEFYKQRRRWVPSTIANLILVIKSHRKITLSNDSISILFILYQLLLVFSTLISPSTVILFIATGLTALNQNMNEVVLIIVLCIISVLYGLVCVYATEKTQIDVAKVLTLIFSIVMAIVLSKLLSDTINAVIDGDPMENKNQTVTNFQFPLDFSTTYTSFLAAIFVMTGILHFNEFSCLLHSFWYLICLPSGYLFLTIYSASNINNRSWGTRESASQSKAGSWLDYYFDKWQKFLGLFWRCIGRKPTIKINAPHSFKCDNLIKDSKPDSALKLSQDVENWLKKIKCEKYAAKFKHEGYTELDFIASMNMDDIVAIGVDKRGFRLKLENEIKRLNTPELFSGVPDDVKTWLNNLKLGQYEELFESEGYSTKDDVENLKGLELADLKLIGITRRAHLNQLVKGLHYLRYPSDNKIQINRTKRSFEAHAETKQLSDECKEEHDFWIDLADKKLKPESAILGNFDELKKKLKDLRNISLLVLLLTNIMWIVFLYTLVFPQIAKYNLPDRAFSLFFLVVFSIIACIQFIALIFHRFITLVHLLARTKLKNKRLRAAWFEQSSMHTQHT